MPRYAAGTSVPVDRSVAQIRQLLVRFGASQFAFAVGEKTATLAFVYQGRPVRFDLPLPDRNDPRFHHTETGRPRRNEDGAYRAWDSECRAKWRSLHLYVKALVVAVQEGLVDFDRAFFHDIVMPGGRTVGQHLIPQIQDAVRDGKVGAPLLLPN